MPDLSPPLRHLMRTTARDTLSLTLEAVLWLISALLFLSGALASAVRSLSQ